MNIITGMGFEIFLKANNDDVFNDFSSFSQKRYKYKYGFEDFLESKE
jgi:hypothetical protein